MDCYCAHMRETEEGRAILAAEGIPDGFCGICSGVGDDGKCGKPGHILPFPGPVPCTGCWCAECYQAEAALAATIDWDAPFDDEEDEDVR